MTDAERTQAYELVVHHDATDYSIEHNNSILEKLNLAIRLLKAALAALQAYEKG